MSNTSANTTAASLPDESLQLYSEALGPIIVGFVAACILICYMRTHDWRRLSDCCRISAVFGLLAIFGGTVVIPLLAIMLLSPVYAASTSVASEVLPIVGLAVCALLWGSMTLTCCCIRKKALVLFSGRLHFAYLLACCGARRTLQTALKDPSVALSVCQLYAGGGMLRGLTQEDVILSLQYAVTREEDGSGGGEEQGQWQELDSEEDRRAPAAVMYALIRARQVDMGVLARHTLQQHVLLRMALMGDVDALAHAAATDDVTMHTLSSPRELLQCVHRVVKEFTGEVGSQGMRPEAEMLSRPERHAALELPLHSMFTPPGHSSEVPLATRVHALLHAASVACNATSAAPGLPLRELVDTCKLVFVHMLNAEYEYACHYHATFWELWIAQQQSCAWQAQHTVQLIKDLRVDDQHVPMCTEAIELPVALMLITGQDVSAIAAATSGPSSLRTSLLLQLLRMTPAPFFAAHWCALTCATAAVSRSLLWAELPRLRGLAKWVAQARRVELQLRHHKPLRVTLNAMAGLARAAWVRRRHVVLLRTQVIDFRHRPPLLYQQSQLRRKAAAISGGSWMNSV